MSKSICWLLPLCLLVMGCKEELIRGVRDHEMRKITGVLAESGIVVERTRVGDNSWSLMVDPECMVPAMQLIEQYHLIEVEPADESGDSLFMSEAEQKLRTTRQVSRTIERTIRSIDGVLDAKVLLTLPEKDSGLGKLSTKGSASLLVLATPGLMITASELQQLVAGAGGMVASEITVLIKGVRFPASSQREIAASSPLAQALGAVAGGIIIIAGLLILRRAELPRRPASHERTA